MTSTKDLERLLIDKRITRRDFIERMTALGLTAAIPGALQSVAAATPQRGGRLRVGSSGGSTTNDFSPLQGECCTEFTGLMHNAFHGRLIDFDAKSNPVGDIAESWEASPDAMTWTFKLREGVEFHDGKTLDAEDVVYSINLHRGESKSPALSMLKPIKDVKADGKNVVVFTLDAGNADFVALLGDEHVHMTPAGSTDWWKAPGTGPFVLDNFEPGVRIFGKRHPNYFMEGLPYFDELEILNIQDLAAKTNALRTGQVDLIDHPDPKTLHLLKQDANLQIIQLKGMRHFTAPMNTTVAPYDNNDVRLALKYAIDRETILNTLFRDQGSLGNDHPISAINRYHADELEQRTYDPDKAKAHLQKAGLEGHTFELHASPGAFAECVDMAVLMQESASKAGIKIEIKREPADGYWDSIWMKKDWCFSYWSGRPTEDMMFAIAYEGGGPWNEAHWTNEKFDQLLRAARVEFDEAKRREMYVEMQTICRDEGGSVIPIFQDQVMAAVKKLSYNEPLAAFRMWDGNKAAERWWFS